MTLPVRFFCSTQAVAGRAIHMGRSLTSKRTSMASAWRVAMATMLAFQRQCRSSPVQRSETWKSSYMISRVTLRRAVLQGKEGPRDKGHAGIPSEFKWVNYRHFLKDGRADRLIMLRWQCPSAL